jgi:HPt (histidine-containing phosphotransfer) domain-containing protein
VTGQTSPATPGAALPPLSDRLGGVLSSIAAQARRTNLSRTADLSTALDGAAGRGLNTAGWADAERTAHQLAGSAGTFGFDVVSEIARSLERFCADASVAGGPDPVRLAEARALLDQASAELADGIEL